ncbi:MAG: arginine--tRNA ligase, partial [Bacteroidetes bacterium HGW-Bacteroidetes-22]
IYYESNTYLTGKTIVAEGLENGILAQKEDGSVWIDLTNDGLDEKLLLRSDGTSVYMTQDLGTADLRYGEFHPQSMIYVVGNEQNYHFDVLKIALARLNKPWAATIRHLSYGMVELPDGKMKSREGTVVDADDLMDQMYDTARQMTEELGKADDMTEPEASELYRKVSLAALKYFILKVDPKKNMLFNPADSIDFNGNTGPFIQYTFARIKSILRKIDNNPDDIKLSPVDISLKERQVVRLVMQFPQIVIEAGKEMSPALIANYCFELAKEFNQFYHDFSILHENIAEKKAFRIVLAWQTSEILRNGMSLLGIEMPERM